MKFEKMSGDVFQFALKDGDGLTITFLKSEQAICLRDQLNTLLPVDTIDIASAWRSKAARMEQELAALKAENDRLRVMVAKYGVGTVNNAYASGNGMVVTKGGLYEQWLKAQPPASITKDANAAMITRDGPPRSQESHINALHGELERDAALCRGLAKANGHGRVV